jgi:hypothetical protein
MDQVQRENKWRKMKEHLGLLTLKNISYERSFRFLLDLKKVLFYFSSSFFIQIKVEKKKRWE